MIIIFFLLILTMAMFAFREPIISDLSIPAKSIYIVLLVALMTISPYLMLRAVMVPNSTRVATIYVTGDEKSLFQDNDTKQYFTTEVVMWNPWDSTRRNYVDTITAEQYIAAYNELQELSSKID